ncbi:hypothetical protein DSCO28_71930 [Desulfosarcina ovata subsp. sediminis]|uniref:Helix-turn-helix domain-containing protein n=1 Tax=Desulfosarcina ovata subsp. sediminis TaxID=885957 RepID=A0A5K8A2A6_9BACT|nr:helix-turn-helix domain-containing protein [Desulfosarcina ovata]BBO86627.1 hypothetical protein DSCO28_71930 [Desulfosarcina ovata subsp. sediminis]
MKLITVRRVAEILDVSTRHVYRLAETGSITALKTRGAVRIVEDSLNSYIQDQITIFQVENGIFRDSVDSGDWRARRSADTMVRWRCDYNQTGVKKNGRNH